MELVSKFVFLSSFLYSGGSEEFARNKLKEDMKSYFFDDYEEVAGLNKFIENIWSDSHKNSFQKRTKDKVVKFFFEEERRKILWGEITKEEVYKTFFVYSFEHLTDTFKSREKLESYDYEFIKSYNEYVEHRENELENLFEYQETYFYLYRLHSYNPSVIREVIVFNEQSNNSLSCTYYRYVPRTYHGAGNNDAKYIFTHKGNVLASSHGRVFCFFPPSRNHEPKQQDSGFVTLSLMLGGSVKGGLFTKLSDASFEPASGRLTLEEIKDIEKEKEESIEDLVISYDRGHPLHRRYKEALNNKNHTTGKADNLLLFNPQYQSEIISREIVFEDDKISPTKEEVGEEEEEK